MKFVAEGSTLNPIFSTSVLNHSRVLTTFATVSLKYLSSFILSAPKIIEGIFIVYELYENLTSLIYLMSFSLPIAYPIRSPAMERDLENVLTTKRLSYESIKGSALSPPKSTYASSTITTTS